MSGAPDVWDYPCDSSDEEWADDYPFDASDGGEKRLFQASLIELALHFLPAEAVDLPLAEGVEGDDGRKLAGACPPVDGHGADMEDARHFRSRHDLWHLW